MKINPALDFRHCLPPELVIASIRAPLRAGGRFSWFPLDESLALHQIDAVCRAVLTWLGDQPMRCWPRADRRSSGDAATPDTTIPSFLLPLTSSWLRDHANVTERVYLSRRQSA